MPSKRVLLLLALLDLLFGAAASSGDAAPDFRRCTAACAASGCTDAAAPAQRRCSPLCRPGGGQQQRRQSVAWPLRLWRWDCAADCAYLCMWQREEAKQLSAPSGGTPARPEKYFGKVGAVVLSAGSVHVMEGRVKRLVQCTVGEFKSLNAVQFTSPVSAWSAVPVPCCQLLLACVAAGRVPGQHSLLSWRAAGSASRHHPPQCTPPAPPNAVALHAAPGHAGASLCALLAPQPGGAAA